MIYGYDLYVSRNQRPGTSDFIQPTNMKKSSSVTHQTQEEKLLQTQKTELKYNTNLRIFRKAIVV